MREEMEERLRKAQTVVFRLLKFRLRSEKELREKLKAKKLPSPIIKQTIAYFKDLDLIDDRRFARQWTSSRLKKPLGINRIRMELKEKGISPAIIEGALKEVTDQYEESEVVIALAQYRASKYRTCDPEKTKQRVYGYLLRRGFSVNDSIKAIKTL